MDVRKIVVFVLLLTLFTVKLTFGIAGRGLSHRQTKSKSSKTIWYL